MVIRSGDLDPGVVRADAERYHAIYGWYGISVFAARDATAYELAQQAPLVRFEVLTLVRVGDLLTAGSGSNRPTAAVGGLMLVREDRGRDLDRLDPVA